MVYTNLYVIPEERRVYDLHNGGLRRKASTCLETADGKVSAQEA